MVWLAVPVPDPRSSGCEPVFDGWASRRKRSANRQLESGQQGV